VWPLCFVREEVKDKEVSKNFCDEKAMMTVVQRVRFDDVSFVTPFCLDNRYDIFFSLLRYPVLFIWINSVSSG
jgi:hypothetical protein